MKRTSSKWGRGNNDNRGGRKEIRYIFILFGLQIESYSKI